MTKLTLGGLRGVVVEEAACGALPGGGSAGTESWCLRGDQLLLSGQRHILKGSEEADCALTNEVSLSKPRTQGGCPGGGASGRGSGTLQ